MPNNCLSVLYKHIIQVENKNVGLKVGGGGGTNIPLPPPIKKVGAYAPLTPPPPPPAGKMSAVDKEVYNMYTILFVNKSDFQLLKGNLCSF